MDSASSHVAGGDETVLTTNNDNDRDVGDVEDDAGDGGNSYTSDSSAWIWDAVERDDPELFGPTATDENDPRAHSDSDSGSGRIWSLARSGRFPFGEWGHDPWACDSDAVGVDADTDARRDPSRTPTPPTPIPPRPKQSAPPPPITASTASGSGSASSSQVDGCSSIVADARHATPPTPTPPSVVVSKAGGQHLRGKRGHPLCLLAHGGQKSKKMKS